MAPAKQPRKSPKSTEKFVDKTISKMKRMNKKKNYQGFSMYIYKLLKSVSQENLSLSKKSMGIINNFLNDMIEKISAEAGRLVANGKKTTMGSRDIETAVKLLVPGELAMHANLEGMKAVTRYNNSHADND